MAWGRISDDFHDHPKVAELTVDMEGLAALGLWTLALAWVRADRRRAGVVPVGIAMRLAASNGKQLACRLLEAKLWDEVPGGWRFHDFEDIYSPEDLSIKRAAAGRAGGIASGKSRSASKAEANTEQLASFHEAKQLEASHARAGATTHFPLRPKNSSPTDAARRPAEAEPTPPAEPPGFVEFWDVYPRKTGKGDARKAWLKATKKIRPIEITVAASRFRRDPNRDDAFTPHPATWLNRESWADGPLPVRPAGQGRDALPPSNAPTALADDERCPQHRAYRATACPSCKSERLAKGDAA